MSKEDKGSEEFINAVYENIKQDREMLKDLYNDIKESASSNGIGVAAVGENLVKLADALTKQTNQIVELAKLRAKAEEKKIPEPDENDLNFEGDDLQNMFEQIESAKKH